LVDVRILPQLFYKNKHGMTNLFNILYFCATGEKLTDFPCTLKRLPEALFTL